MSMGPIRCPICGDVIPGWARESHAKTHEAEAAAKRAHAKLRPVDPERMRYIEKQAREIGEQLIRAIDRAHGKGEIGFALFLFSFSGSEMTYIANSNREDMIKMLTEFINANSPPLTWDEQHG